MKTEIIKAEEENLLEIMFIYKLNAEDLISKGFTHWNSAYPSYTKVRNNVLNGQVYLLRKERTTVGVITLNEEQDSTYNNLTWKGSSNALVVHRIAVVPYFQKRGYGTQLLEFAEEFAKKNKFQSIRLDTYTKNQTTSDFFSNRGYTKVGEIGHSQDLLLYTCYEKILA
ncbi:MAG TPA: GNAT family N-acetyltransferase [Williamwhitmania sp.]|nr:GNAT family N-acetyltransferase [Williamwhitmania sp.]